MTIADPYAYAISHQPPYWPEVPNLDLPKELARVVKAETVHYDAWAQAELELLEAEIELSASHERESAAIVHAVKNHSGDPGPADHSEALASLRYKRQVEQEHRLNVSQAAARLDAALDAHGHELMALAADKAERGIEAWAAAVAQAGQALEDGARARRDAFAPLAVTAKYAAPLYMFNGEVQPPDMFALPNTWEPEARQWIRQMRHALDTQKASNSKTPA